MSEDYVKISEKFLSESRGVLQIRADLRLICVNPRIPVARFHAVHLVISGDYELVQRVAVDAKRRRPDADSHTRKTISPDWQ